MGHVNKPRYRIFLLAFASLMLMAANTHAATRTVTKVQDTSDGVCDVDCSLREAIDVAANGDRIVFSSLFNSAQTITLSAVVPYNGGLIISMDLTITGPGADLLTVNGINNQVFEITSGTVVLSGMTIGNGDGVLNFGNTTISECILTGNDGQIDNREVMTVVNSTIKESTGFSAAVYNDGELTILNSTVSNNNAKGIDNRETLTVTNSTVSGNGSGAGIQHSAGTATISNCTIADNVGTGIDAIQGTITVRSSIVAASINAGLADVEIDPAATVISGGYNLIGIDRFGAFSLFVDQTGTLASPLDPLLDPLADYGGMTETHRLKTTSTAIDKGYSFGVTEDQRGFQRPFDKATYSNAVGGDGSDIGAYELQFAIAVTGFVLTPLGNPVKHTRVLISSPNGEHRAVQTDKFGFYSFKNVARNRIYRVGATNRRCEVVPQFWMITVQEENIENLNFTCIPASVP